MPDTEITVRRDVERLDLTVDMPLSDLLLALPTGGLNDDDMLSEREQEALCIYFARHTLIESANAVAKPFVIDGMTLSASHHPDVGQFRKLRVRMSALVSGDRPVALRYDAIIHRVANHEALVRDRAGQILGRVRYSLADRSTNRLSIPKIADRHTSKLSNVGVPASHNFLLWANLAVTASVLIILMSVHRSKT